jgi:hypothetical protein
MCLSQNKMTHTDMDEIAAELMVLDHENRLPFLSAHEMQNEGDRQASMLMVSTRLYDSVSQVAMQHHVNAEDVYMDARLMNTVVALVKASCTFSFADHV